MMNKVYLKIKIKINFLLLKNIQCGAVNIIIAKFYNFIDSNLHKLILVNINKTFLYNL